ncbi:hypothetical protein [Macrococcus sp. DPC7161]|uniref:hypothetical protein n=1 Tax=Macrococcus sp. DPC7161 TaxID=2507060 RepID=UPI00100BF88A|nr:hypothetical protein [Macrococcus sp. DPC7161]RXK17651.1 hypothetical protein ER639_08920 [Macrococcus sp. DPC7161]
MMTYLDKDETLESGIYEKVTVNANSDTNGSIELNEIMIEPSGIFTVNGKLNAPFVEVKGQLHITDTLETQTLNVAKDASLKVEKQTVGNTLHNKGKASFETDVFIPEITNDAELYIDGLTDTKSFKSTGLIEVHQMLTAEKINITLGSASYIKAMKAQKIDVKADRELLVFKDDDHKLTSKEIIGNDITLENTVCDVVRGKNVKILNNCMIKTIEYSESYSFDGDSNSEVYEFIKVSTE